MSGGLGSQGFVSQCLCFQDLCFLGVSGFVFGVRFFVSGYYYFLRFFFEGGGSGEGRSGGTTFFVL